jgi:glutathione S-transferase
MKLHWSPRSPFVRKVMIVAHERGLVDRLTCMRTVAAMTVPHAELMKDNPLSKIPTLILDNGTALYDSPVICEYLDSLDGKPQLFPLDRAARLVALRRQALGDGLLDLLVAARNERLRAEPSDAHLASAAVRTSAVLRSLEGEADALAGSDFSIGILRSAARSPISISALPNRIGASATRGLPPGTPPLTRGHRHARRFRSTIRKRLPMMFLGLCSPTFAHLPEMPRWNLPNDWRSAS